MCRQFFLSLIPKPMAYNLWVTTPLGVTFYRGCISDAYITIYNNNKITLMK